LEKTVIRSPYTAVITDRYVDVGDRLTAMPRVEIMQIVDPRVLFAEIDVPERFLGQVREHAPAVYGSADAEPMVGRVELINGRVDPETRTFRARIGIDNRSGRLKAGGLARVVLEIASDAQGDVVPRRAVSFSNGQPSVFVYRPDGRVDRRPGDAGDHQFGSLPDPGRGGAGRAGRGHQSGSVGGPVARAAWRRSRRRPRPRGSRRGRCGHEDRRGFHLAPRAGVDDDAGHGRVRLGVVPQIGINLFPDVDLPIVTVTVRYEGADPKTVETEVTDKIEEAVNTISGIKTLRSESSEGLSQVFIEFDLEEKADAVSQEVRDKVAAIRGDLPRDIESPIIEKFDPDSAPILSLVLSGPASIGQLTWQADEVIKPRIEGITGVGNVRLVGHREARGPHLAAGRPAARPPVDRPGRDRPAAARRIWSRRAGASRRATAR
jgi:hypothetical protein